MASTKERIVTEAVALFNESGTSAVSTNHIAQALGISPGNLYFHFRNKEAIIRTIFERLNVDWQAACSLPTDSQPTIDDLRHILEGNFTIVWRYRFYYRELPALIRRDAALAARYREVRSAGLANIEALFAAFIAAGVMRAPDDPATLAQLAEACWLMADFWLPFAELSGAPIGAADTAHGVALIFTVFRPYFTPAALAALHPVAAN